MIDPKDIIEQFSVEELCQTADDYFKARVDETPLMAKPFSNLFEAPVILQNLGYLLTGLRLAQTMTVLDFAAGTCWLSRYLNQLGCRTISCDVSGTALEIGKRLFREYPIVGNPISEPTFLHFDGHRIDLPDGCVDRIICHDGFHHVPNQEEVISELARVLKDGGVAGFSEPGRFHSQSPQSQHEMRYYKVLENDISVAGIFATARKYGFTDVRVKALADIEISLDEYELLTSQRNRRLLRTIAKQVGNMTAERSIFFLFKGEYVPDSRSHMGLACSIETVKDSYSVKAGEDFDIPARVTNTGSARWLTENIQGIGIVRVGTHLYDEKDQLIDYDFTRNDIPARVEPGDTFVANIGVRFDSPGRYKLAVDMVSELICWFETVGSIPRLVAINVD